MNTSHISIWYVQYFKVKSCTLSEEKDPTITATLPKHSLLTTSCNRCGFILIKWCNDFRETANSNILHNQVTQATKAAICLWNAVESLYKPYKLMNTIFYLFPVLYPTCGNSAFFFHEYILFCLCANTAQTYLPDIPYLKGKTRGQKGVKMLKNSCMVWQLKAT